MSRVFAFVRAICLGSSALEQPELLFGDVDIPVLEERLSGDEE
jgi:hypothetical protein